MNGPPVAPVVSTADPEPSAGTTTVIGAPVVGIWLTVMVAVIGAEVPNGLLRL